MKLRSLICVSAVAAASAALALDGANTFARLKVNSNFKDSIIAIPLAGCGESDAKIYVTNLVMTAGLADGDTLMYKEGENWYAWEIENGAWKAINTSTTKGGVTFTPAADAAQLDCGKACWLVRSSTSNPVYLYGQVKEAKPQVTVAAGTATAIAYTIVGCPNEAAPLDLFQWKPAGGADGDMLIVPAAGVTGQKTYRYNGTAWTKMTTAQTTFTNPFTKETTTSNVTNWTPIEAAGTDTIAAGCGFMYGRKATTPLTLSWN